MFNFNWCTCTRIHSHFDRGSLMGCHVPSFKWLDGSIIDISIGTYQHCIICAHLQWVCLVVTPHWRWQTIEIRDEYWLIDLALLYFQRRYVLGLNYDILWYRRAFFTIGRLVYCHLYFFLFPLVPITIYLLRRRLSAPPLFFTILMLCIHTRAEPASRTMN